MPIQHMMLQSGLLIVTLHVAYAAATSCGDTSREECRAELAAGGRAFIQVANQVSNHHPRVPKHQPHGSTRMPGRVPVHVQGQEGHRHGQSPAAGRNSETLTSEEMVASLEAPKRSTERARLEDSLGRTAPTGHATGPRGITHHKHGLNDAPVNKHAQFSQMAAPVDFPQGIAAERSSIPDSAMEGDFEGSGASGVPDTAMDERWNAAVDEDWMDANGNAGASDAAMDMYEEEKPEAAADEEWDASAASESPRAHAEGDFEGNGKASHATMDKESYEKPAKNRGASDATMDKESHDFQNEGHAPHSRVKDGMYESNEMSKATEQENDKTSSSQNSKESFGDLVAPEDWLNKLKKYKDLNEEGYAEVASKKSNALMASYMRRLAKALGFTVVHEGGFLGVVPFYSGVKGKQSFQDLLQEIETAGEAKCGWLSDEAKMPKKDAQAPAAHNLTEEAYAYIAHQRNGDMMRKFIKQVIRDMNLQVIDNGALEGLRPFHSCETDTKSLEELRLDLEHGTEGCGKWLVPQGSKVQKSHIMPADAPLTEEGYSAIATKKSNSEMEIFARRLAKDLGIEITDMGGLEGIIPFHSCAKETQSLEALQKEIEDAASAQSWAKHT